MNFSASLNRSLALQNKAFKSMAQGLGNPSTVVITLGSNTSDALAAAVIIGKVEYGYNEHGGLEKKLPCAVSIERSLLPPWATVDALPRNGTVTTGGKIFKISNADDNNAYLYITAFHWAAAA
jgi:hypothetical protein